MAHVDPIRVLLVRQMAPYLRAFDELVRQTARVEAYRSGKGKAPAVGALAEAQARLAEVIAQTRALADLIGRRETVRGADAVIVKSWRQLGRGGANKPPVSVATGTPAPDGDLPRVPYTEAIADIVAREPRLAAGAAEVQAIYNTEHGFALAQSASLDVTKRVQQAIAKSLQVGQGAMDAAEVIAEVGNFTHAYADTVFRTNAATAFSAGRFRQMADPAVAYAIGALRYTAIGDADTRKNHQAADGLIAAPSDPVWSQIAPPLGFRCRCGLDLMSWPELERRRLVVDGKVRPATLPSGARPDAGFRHTGRPDIAIYGGSL